MKTKYSALTVALATVLVLTGLSPANAAAPSDSSDEGQVVAFVRDSAGNLIPIDEAVETPHLEIDEPAPAEPGTVTPYLIDFNDWFNCFSLNQSDNVFSLYTFFQNGYHQDVRLKCGEQNDATGTGWGYKHIRAGHEGHWQDKLNIARARGWDPSTQGVEGWDDLMNVGAGTSITYWNYVSPIKGNNTKCTVSSLTFARVGSNGSWQIVYEFNVVAAFAINNDRLITTYPTEKTVC